MPYTAFDRFVAWCRFRAAAPHIRNASRVCDFGCGLDGRFLQYLRGRIRLGVGLDYQLQQPHATLAFVQANITQGCPLRSGVFDHVVMLAVLEHLDCPEAVLDEAYRILVPGGSLIMTWPNAVVDPLLGALHRLRVVSDEMESEQHQARMSLSRLQAILAKLGFMDFQHRTFELGLNNLVVTRKPI